jgi:DNA-binding IclR family transcriptional regulator
VSRALDILELFLDRPSLSAPEMAERLALPRTSAHELVTSLSRLRLHLTEVSSRGLAYDDCESNEAVHCVAAPVYDHTAAMVAGMSISVPALRWNEERRRQWGELVRTGATTLSRRLGHRGGGLRP